jgi:hypothetical protein
VALDTFDEVHHRVLLRCPAAGTYLARDWVKNAFRTLGEHRLWSWQTTQDTFMAKAVYNTGTVAITRGSTTLTGTGTTWISGMIGRQFRTGTNERIYTITARASNTSVTIDQPWAGATATGKTYEIWNAYFTAPQDFQAFVSVWDPNFNWQLHLHVSQEALNSVDAQRSQAGTTYVVADLDYVSIESGLAVADGTAITVPVPRFELWPHRKVDYSWPFLYKTRVTDLDDSSATLPRYVRGDVLLELALMEAAIWPGDGIKKNPYAGEWRMEYHRRKLYGDQRRGLVGMIPEMERQDNEIFQQDVAYAQNQNFAPYPFFDTDFMQNHALL